MAVGSQQNERINLNYNKGQDYLKNNWMITALINCSIQGQLSRPTSLDSLRMTQSGNSSQLAT